MSADWRKIRNEYINGHISYRKLAEKYSVPFQTLRDHAAKEKWTEQRTERRHKIDAKTEQKVIKQISDKEADRMVQLQAAADTVLEQILVAAEQVGYKKDKVTTKVRRYDKQSNETREQTVLSEELRDEKGAVDTRMARDVMACIKDYAEICALTSGKKEQQTSGIEYTFDFEI